MGVLEKEIAIATESLPRWQELCFTECRKAGSDSLIQSSYGAGLGPPVLNRKDTFVQEMLGKYEGTGRGALLSLPLAGLFLFLAQCSDYRTPEPSETPLDIKLVPTIEYVQHRQTYRLKLSWTPPIMEEVELVRNSNSERMVVAELPRGSDKYQIDSIGPGDYMFSLQPKNGSAVGESKITVPAFPSVPTALTGIIEPAAQLNRYRVKLSWTTPTVNSRIRLKRIRGGVEHELGMFDTNAKVFTDEVSGPGDIQYVMSGEGSNIASYSVTVPKDVVISESVDLDGSISVGRFVIEDGVIITTNGANLQIDANQLVSHGGVIQSFKEHQQALTGVAGRSGGLIKIRALTARGSLKVVARGENGGAGEHGEDGKAGKNGIDGDDIECDYEHHASVTVRVNEITEFPIFFKKYPKGTIPPTVAELKSKYPSRLGLGGYIYDVSKVHRAHRGNLTELNLDAASPRVPKWSFGGNGTSGTSGGAGGDGIRGGDTGRVYISIKDPSGFDFKLEQSEGVGGRGGRGGMAGGGGRGGKAGEGPHDCADHFDVIHRKPTAGESGSAGEPGLSGVSGSAGSIQSYCVRLGDDSQGDCVKEGI